MVRTRSEFTDTIAGGETRLSTLVERFHSVYGTAPTVAVSAPGRIELIGNHTDHNNGCVIACAVDHDAVAVAGPCSDRRLELRSEGWDTPFIVDRDADPDSDRDDASRLMRGVARGLEAEGWRAPAYRAVLESRVPPGSGLSSSAAFAVALGAIHATLAGESPPADALARAGRYAENHHMGKPSGLMDQLASAVGGISLIDFASEAQPGLTPLDGALFDESLSLCTIATGGSHADLTSEYAAVPAEMRALAAELGGRTLREIAPDHFERELPRLRARCGDRAVLRGFHFFDEQDRVMRCARALESGAVDAFLATVAQSGRSSWMLLQNVAPQGATTAQPMALVLAVAERALRQHSIEGAVRVHGGGFGGTILVVTAGRHHDTLRTAVAPLLGDRAVELVSIRSAGVIATRI